MLSQRFIVTATPPTPNGDFHVGHICGPYLGGDVFARYQRMRGHDVVYVSSADRNQSYVVTTAERMGVDPDQLATSCHATMTQTLRAAQLSMDIFNDVDAAHKNLVRNFFKTIEERGNVARKKKRLPYSLADERYLFESFVFGFCPVCWAATAGAICETCGHPNDAQTIDLIASRGSSQDIAWREHEVAVLELERFRDRFEAFYQEKQGLWRPHLIEFAREMLAKPLPDYPLSYLSDWGIPVPFDGLEGQVLNVWAEMLPGLINSTAEAFAARGEARENGMALWRRDAETKLIQFLGYDNSFFFAFVHPALSWAHGDIVLPDTILTNEFLELDNFKFSTSKNHLIWARDLVSDRDADAVRFYLALINPEHQKTNFTLAAMDELVATKFTRPFRGAVEAVAGAIEASGETGEEWTIDARLAERLATALARFAQFHETETFSLQRIAEHFSQLLIRIEAGGKRLAEDAPAPGQRLEEMRYLTGLLHIVLPAVMQPLLPGFSSRMASALGDSPPTRWPTSLIGLPCGIPSHILRQAANAIS